MSVSEVVSAITAKLSARIADMEALLPIVGDQNVLFFEKTGLCVRLFDRGAKVIHVENATQFPPSITEADLVKAHGVIKNAFNERAKLMRYNSVLRIKILELRKMIESVQ